jgi:hypothetical protein
LIVGRPDLSRLPLIRGKDFLEWSGDAGLVATRLREVVTAQQARSSKAPPSRSPPAPWGGVPAVAARPVPPPLPNSQPPRPRSWLSRMLKGGN